MVCINGACDVALPGDTCDEPIVLDPADLPIEVSGDTEAGFTDHFGASCAIEGWGQPDIVYQFTPDEGGTYAFGLVMNDYDPTVVTVTEGCDAITSCLGSVDLYMMSGESMDVMLEAGVTYTVVVDSFPGESGAYKLFITPP